jgi:hypothetical protein
VGVLSVLAFASSAQAATVTLGQLFKPTMNRNGTTTVVIAGESVGTYPVPAPGVITSWSFQEAGSTVGGLKLKTLRAAGRSRYTVTGEATAGPQSTNSVNTYVTSIPVQTGDLIGFSYSTATPTPVMGLGALGFDNSLSVAGDQAPGSTATYTAGIADKAPLLVREVLQPGVNSVSPSSGPGDGGTEVTITGHNFSGATAVTFGGVPARSFTVNSDTSITAVSPAHTTATVDVMVTTAGGQSPASPADRFVYTSSPNTGGVSASGSGGLAATQTHRVWREPKHPKLAQISATSRPIGDTFNVTLADPARVGLMFKQLLPGRKVNGRCVAPRPSNRLRPPCTRTRKSGRLSISGHAGLNAVRFFGWLSKTKRLLPGKYVVVITATTPGVGSTSKALGFRIVA